MIAGAESDPQTGLSVLGGDPAALIEFAWAMEPGLRLRERSAALDGLAEVLSGDVAPAAPAGRNWQLELLAERAIDAARVLELDVALTLARQVLDDPDHHDAIATARATEALGRTLAWTGTDSATRRAQRMLTTAAELYAALGRREWQGYALFSRGNSVHLQNGELVEAERCIREALDVLAGDSPRRPTVLTFYADVLIALGRWDPVDGVLAEAQALADEAQDQTGQAYATWTRARLASARGDARATERYVRETEREAADWFSIHTGVTFLADAAEMLDRVGLGDEAQAYLQRALAREPDDSFVAQARAALLARTGEPGEALDALQDLVRGRWLEKRLVWRHTLLTAWATYRAGREGAGQLAARALEIAEEAGPGVALAGERDLVVALAPLAEAAGSVPARRLLCSGDELIVRLFGTPRVTRGDGSEVTLPPGRPAELVRIVAVHPHGVGVETVSEWFFPDVAIAVGRHRLRQILSRLRAAAGDVVLRDGDRLVLAPAWVDVRAFLAAADRVRSARGARAMQLAYAALALWSGPPLPTDTYAVWAEPIREQIDYRHLTLLDLVAEQASARGSHQEALTALTSALDLDPDDPSRYTAAAAHSRALGRHGAAELLGRLGELGLAD